MHWLNSHNRWSISMGNAALMTSERILSRPGDFLMARWRIAASTSCLMMSTPPSFPSYSCSVMSFKSGVEKMGKNVWMNILALCVMSSLLMMPIDRKSSRSWFCTISTILVGLDCAFSRSDCGDVPFPLWAVKIEVSYYDVLCLLISHSNCLQAGF